MRMGVGGFSANKDVDVTRDASAVAADILMKLRRSIQAYSAGRASVPDGVGLSQNAASSTDGSLEGERWRERIKRPTVDW